MQLGLIGLGKMGGNMRERIRRAGRLVVATYPNYPPLTYRDPGTNARLGFDVDLAEAIARELRLAAVELNHSSSPSSSTADRTGGLPRVNDSTDPSSGVVICSTGGIRLDWRLLPTLAPRPVNESLPQTTCLRRAERPLSEWKLSARRASASSDTSSSSSYSAACGSDERERPCARACSSCCAARAATAATFAATVESAR